MYKTSLLVWSNLPSGCATTEEWSPPCQGRGDGAVGVLDPILRYDENTKYKLQHFYIIYFNIYIYILSW